MFFDTHVHFDGIGDGPAVSAALDRAAAAGVTRMVAIGGDLVRNEAMVAAAGAEPERLRCAVGYDRDGATDIPDLATLTSLVDAQSAVVAIGEIGLDFFYHPDLKDAQRELFRTMLDLAGRHQLPVVVHSRDADAETLEDLTAHREAWTGEPDRIGVLHCFTRERPMMEALVRLGFHISFSGIVTFRNADPLREVARHVPDDRMLIETDSPYLAPVPHRGKANEPAFVPDVARVLAECRGVPLETIASQTMANGRHLFGW